MVGQLASKAVGWYVGTDVPQKGQYEEEGEEADGVSWLIWAVICRQRKEQVDMRGFGN